jgi:hypothetical protein
MSINYTKCPPKYELQYVKWNGINFDRDKLIKFIKRLKLTRFLSFIPRFNEEYLILNDILHTYDLKRITGLLNNDENIVRMCFIEKWAQIASTDILLINTYSRSTFITISNLPIKDYQLLSKRVEELVQAARNVSYQSINTTDNIAGI